MKDKNLYLKKNFGVEPHNSIYFTDIKYFFNLGHLEPALGQPAPEFVKALKKKLNWTSWSRLQVI